MCSRLCTRPCTGGSANTAVYMAVNTYGRILYSTVLVLFTVYTGNDFKGKEKGKTITGNRNNRDILIYLTPLL